MPRQRSKLRETASKRLPKGLSLVDLVNRDGPAAAAERLQVSKSSVTYWLLIDGYEGHYVYIKAGEKLAAVKDGEIRIL